MADSILSAWTPSPEVDRMMYEDLHLTDPPPAYLRHGTTRTHTSRWGRRGKPLACSYAFQYPNIMDIFHSLFHANANEIYLLDSVLQFYVSVCYVLGPNWLFLIR